MVNFDYRRVFRIREMAFGTALDTVQTGCDVVYMHSTEEESHLEDINRYSIGQMQYTLVHDLTEESSNIFNKFNKNYKYEIRRGEREGIEHELYTTKSIECEKIINEFEKVYNYMFESKGMRNKFNRRLVMEGLKKKQIMISRAYQPEKKCYIVFHAYLADEKSAILMYSASTLNGDMKKEDRNMIGWMNKYLHWYDMLWFKEHGYKRYEWGGISSRDKHDGISQFKMGFGGEMKMYYNYLTANSLFGRFYLWLVKRQGKSWN
ncbi:MAG: hypothetical protein NC489_30400 [Ruminococcus flavefaciens]|nr:hypothetical protein [Ruminococcus flavefaciens]